MDHLTASLSVVLTTLFFGYSYGLTCLEDESCVGHVVVKRVNNITYCCADPSADYMDLKQVAPGNVTCHCTTEAAAAAAYADRTMGQGLRSCHWGPACEKEKMSLNDYNLTFCCLGDNQYFDSKRFGSGNAVCRCRGSSLPLYDLDRYVPSQTLNASSSGETCSYDWGCTDNPSTVCQSDFATFCCYGSRGIETRNDLGLNSTRCTCTNDFMGTRCDENDPFPVMDTNSTKGLKCRSGIDCKTVSPKYSCSHSNKLFCCPFRGLNLTITDDVISSCTCVSGSHHCNKTFTKSGITASVWRSSINIVGFTFGTVFWWGLSALI